MLSSIINLKNMAKNRQIIQLKTIFAQETRKKHPNLSTENIFRYLMPYSNSIFILLPAQSYNSVPLVMIQPFYPDSCQTKHQKLMQTIFPFAPLEPIELTNPFNQTVFQLEPVETCVEIEQREGKGRWSIKQQSRYIHFLKKNMEVMAEMGHRRTQKIFVKMAQMVKTRTSFQCRSHHQKMVKYRMSLQRIIQFYGGMRKAGEKQVLTENKPKTAFSGKFVEQSFHSLYSVKRQGNQFTFFIQESKVQNY